MARRFDIYPYNNEDWEEIDNPMDGQYVKYWDYFMEVTTLKARIAFLENTRH